MAERYLPSRSSFSAMASRINLARPYVPTSASMPPSISGGKRTGVGFPIGFRPIGRGVARCDPAGKKTIPFSVDGINDAVYINGIVYGGKMMTYEFHSGQLNAKAAADLAWFQMGCAQEIVINLLGCTRDRFDLSPDAMLVDDLGADSLDMVEIQTHLEEHGFTAPDEAFTSHMRLRDLAALIQPVGRGI